jgi:hypothetical protein
MSSSESDEFEVIDQLEASLSPEELNPVNIIVTYPHKLLALGFGYARPRSTNNGRSLVSMEVCGLKASLALGSQ